MALFLKTALWMWILILVLSLFPYYFALCLALGLIGWSTALLNYLNFRFRFTGKKKGNKP